MNAEIEEDFATRRRHLTAQIARQRGELAQAFKNLEKPIHYAEYGMRGFGFLRSNPWIFAAVPAVFSIVSNLFGSKKRGSIQSQPPKGIIGKVKRPVSKVAGYAWELFQLYRRVRQYLP